MSAVPSVVLWGSEHPQRGSVGLAGLDAETAVALSAGLHPKPSPTLDPNEDAILAAVGHRWRLLAVADGHYGFDAARGAISGLQAALARLDDAVVPAAGLGLLVDAAVTGVRSAVLKADPRRRHSRTALTIVLTGPQAAHVCQWGDTAAVRVRSGKAKLLASPAPFLSPDSEKPKRAAVRLRSDDLVVVASDGITGFLGRDWIHRIGHTVASSTGVEAIARALVNAAFAGGAGDHVAVGAMFAGPGERASPAESSAVRPSAELPPQHKRS